MEDYTQTQSNTASYGRASAPSENPSDEAAVVEEATSSPAQDRGAAVGEQTDSVEQVQGELNETRDKLLRQAAEFQNYRRRTEQEKATLVDLGKEIVVRQMLDVLDDFHRTIEAAEAIEQKTRPDQAYQTLKQGVDLIYRKFMDEMARLGVEPIEAVGAPFDENLHEAMLQQPAPEGTAPGTVINEFQKGYRMGERVVRHARVVVAG